MLYSFLSPTLCSISGITIWLNGPAGSGKTSLAKALLKHIPVAHHFDIDEFEFKADIHNTSRFLNNVQFQFLQNIRQHLKSDGVAIVDYILYDHMRDLEVMHGFRQYPIYLIEIFCSLEELMRREAFCKGKQVDQTRLQYFLTADRWITDLRLDSNLLQSEEIAREVIQHIQTQSPVDAFSLNINRIYELLGS